MFTYRFTEILSAGTIPVIHSDGWVLPFRPELIDWQNECAVISPEIEMNHTVKRLRSMNATERCERQQRCFELYQQYIATPEGVLAGILEGLERMRS